MRFSQRTRFFLVMAAVLPVACGQSAGEGAGGEQNNQKHTEKTQGNDQHDSEVTEPNAASKSGKHAGEAEGGEHGGEHGEQQQRVHLNKQQRQRLNLEIGKAEAGSASAIVEAPATVRFNADRVARVGPRLEAKVVKVTKDLGDSVKAGETVAVLDSVELGRAKADYLTARARFNAAYAQYQRDQKLADQKIASEAELLESRAGYQQARAKRDAVRAELRLYGLTESDIEAIAVGGDQPLSRYALTAPVDGEIQKRDLVAGQTVSSEQTPIHVVNEEHMWVMIEAFEKAIPRLATGQKVKLDLQAFPDKTFTGTTDWVSRELDEQSRTVRVRAVVPNDDGLLRAGMFGTARIQTDSQQRFALVPVDAVQKINDKQMVFVPGDKNGVFRAVTVQTGAESGGQIEIRQGIKPGDKLVATGAFDLKSAYTASGRSASHGH